MSDFLVDAPCMQEGHVTCITKHPILTNWVSLDARGILWDKQTNKQKNTPPPAQKKHKSRGDIFGCL